MLGVTFLKSKNKIVKGREAPFHHEAHVNTDVIDLDQTKVYCQAPSHYPLRILYLNSSVVFLEGVIYNASQEIIDTKLNNIVTAFSADENFKSLITSFQEEMTGEYFIGISVDSHWEKAIFFNDYFGRLAVHHYCDASLCIISRNIQSVIEYLPSPTIEKNVLTDLIFLGYPLGEKTLFENVNYFDCGEIYLFDSVNFQLKRIHSTTIDLTYKHRYRSRREFVFQIKTNLASTVRQIAASDFLTNKKIICDLSGGFDSRTVFGCLQTLNVAAKYVSNNILGNESSIATSLMELFNHTDFEIVENASHFYDHVPDSNLIFLTNCTAGVESTKICLEALKPLGQKYSDRFRRLGGIGFTDFIRKGYRDDSGNLLDEFVNGKFNGISLDNACSVSGANPDKYYDYLKQIISTWPEKSNKEIHKKLFFRRTLIMQSRLPDDRERLDFWPIHPLWNHHLCMDVLQHMPLHWRGYYSHTLLLKSIDERLIKVKVDKSYIDFKQLGKMHFMDVKDNSEVYRNLRDTIFRVFKTRKEKNRNTSPPEFINLGRPRSANHSQFDIPYLSALDNYLEVLNRLR